MLFETVPGTRWHERLSWKAALVWITVALVLLPFQKRIDRSVGATNGVAGTESGEAQRRINADFTSPFIKPALLVVTGLAHAADSDSGRADMRQLVAPLLASKAVVGALSPGSSLDTLLVGADKTTAIVVVGLSPLIAEAMDSVRAITAAQLTTLRVAHPGLTLRWTGEPALVGDLKTTGAREARRAELTALPITIVVSVVAFGSVEAALVAVGAAGLAILVSLGLAGALADVMPASTFTRTLVPLLGLALTVDYMLLLMRRAREGADRRSLQRTVALAGGVVALGFTGLALAPTGELRAAAFAGVLTCFVAALAAITLAPISAARGVQIEVAAERAASREQWRRWGWFVVRHPWITLLLSASPLVGLANHARSARLITPLDRLLPPGMESADAYRDLQRAGRAGAAASLRVLLELPSGTPVLTDSGWSALHQATARLGTMPLVASARSLATIGTGDLGVARNVLPALVRATYVDRVGRGTIIDLIPDLRTGEGAAVTLVGRVRALDASEVTGVAGARFLVAGLPAYALDYQNAIVRALPWIVLATSLMTLLAVGVAFRAPVVAVKAVGLNLLVAAASIGATVLIFQDVLGMGSVFPTVPALAFGAAFGTSMDYELFLLGAVREARREGLDDIESIVVGLTRVGGLITRAAAVMACLFLAFSLSSLLPLAMVGCCLAVAVALDATLVRLALVPAMLRIAGRWNWWPGR